MAEGVGVAAEGVDAVGTIAGGISLGWGPAQPMARPERSIEILTRLLESEPFLRGPTLSNHLKKAVKGDVVGITVTPVTAAMPTATAPKAT